MLLRPGTGPHLPALHEGPKTGCGTVPGPPQARTVLSALRTPGSPWARQGRSALPPRPSHRRARRAAAAKPSGPQWAAGSAPPPHPAARVGSPGRTSCPSVTHAHCRALRTRGGGSCPVATERRLCRDRGPSGSLPHAGRVRAEPRRTVSGRRAPQSPGRRGPTHLRAGHAHGHGAHAAVPPATAESPCAPAVGGCGHAGTGRPPTRSPPGPSLCPRSGDSAPAPARVHPDPP